MTYITKTRFTIKLYRTLDEVDNKFDWTRIIVIFLEGWPMQLCKSWEEAFITWKQRDQMKNMVLQFSRC